MHRSRGALSRRRLGPSLLYRRSVVCIIFLPGQRDPNSSKRWKASIHAARLRLLSARSAPGSESPEPILLVTARPAIGCAEERVHFCVDFYPDGLFSRDSPAPGSAATSSAHRFLHERANPCLIGGGQLLQREGDRPHGAFVEVRLVAEAEGRVPRLELVRALEEADDIAVLGVRGHPVPGSRPEGWRAAFDDGMEPLGHGAIRFRHLGNLREHVAFRVRLLRARAAARFRLQLLDALLHRGSFLVRESFDRLAGHGGPLGGLLCIGLWAHRASAYYLWLDTWSPCEMRIRAVLTCAA